MLSLPRPWLAKSTILARRTSLNGNVYSCERAASRANSSAVRAIVNGLRLGIAPSWPRRQCHDVTIRVQNTSTNLRNRVLSRLALCAREWGTMWGGKSTGKSSGSTLFGVFLTRHRCKRFHSALYAPGNAKSLQFGPDLARWSVCSEDQACPLAAGIRINRQPPCFFARRSGPRTQAPPPLFTHPQLDWSVGGMSQRGRWFSRWFSTKARLVRASLSLSSKTERSPPLPWNSSHTEADTASVIDTGSARNFLRIGRGRGSRVLRHAGHDRKSVCGAISALAPPTLPRGAASARCHPPPRSAHRIAVPARVTPAIRGRYTVTYM